MKARIVAICICLLKITYGFSQSIPKANDVRLDIFLRNIHIRYPNVNLTCSSELMKNTYIDYDPRPNEDPVQIVRRVLRQVPFRIERIDTNEDRSITITISHIDKPVLQVRVINEAKESEPDVTVSVQDRPIHAITDADGIAQLEGVADSAVLWLSGINIDSSYTSTRGHYELNVSVKRKPKVLDSTTVSGRHSNGIDQRNLAHLPTAHSSIDSESLNRIVATDIVSHLAPGASGLLYGPGSGNPLGLTIWGRNTLHSFDGPLLVTDNLIYPGYSGDINPYDVNNVTILKDAAAASIWGEQSGNGVIRLERNEGQYNKKAQCTFTTNLTLAEKPNLGYLPWMSPSSFAAAEGALFTSGLYDRLYDPNFPRTPVLSLYTRWRDQGLSKAVVDEQVQQLSGHSAIDDLKRYFYRSRLNQQYHLSVAGGGCTQKYYASFGYDNDPTALVRNRYERYTFRGVYTAHPLSPQLETSLAVNFAHIRQLDNNSGGPAANYPYARMVDDKGKPLSVVHQYNPDFIDTITSNYLQDWHYRPIDELRLADNRYTRTVLNIQSNIDWRINRLLSAQVIYRLFSSWSQNRINYNKASFYVRDLVNQFADLSGPAPVYPIPAENILSTVDTGTTGQNLRAVLNFKGSIKKKYKWKALAGGEISDINTTGQGNMIYGYDGRGNPLQMDYLHLYPTMTNGMMPIPENEGIIGKTSRYISAFSNVYYSHGDQFTLFGSFRLDGSNFIGIENHQKWGNSWSMGVSRQLFNTARSALKWRGSYGCNGNVSSRNANLTLNYLGLNIYGVQQSAIGNSPDPSLGWEKTWIEDGGFDFTFFKDSTSPRGRINGSLDLYWKQAGNLLADDSVPLSTGYSTFFGNVASMHGRGIDLVINSENSRGTIKWTSTLLLSVAKDWISRYPYLPQTPVSYIANGYHRPGESPTGLYSYRWGGLDAFGNPQGYVNGSLSRNYPAIQTNGEYRYNGSTQPTLFGGLLNTFTWKKFSLSARIGFKAGYWFRRSSINYTDLINESSAGHKDFDRRWQRPGDEKITSVPSIPYIGDSKRDDFYLNSEILVTRADHIRLQDCQFSYVWSPSSSNKTPFKQAIFYLYVNNPGILWRANKYGIDPDAAIYGDLPAVRSWSIGVRTTF